VDSARAAGLGAAGAQRLEASYRARTTFCSLEAAYRADISQNISLEPFASITGHTLRAAPFTERGGSAALRAAGLKESRTTGSRGLRADAAAFGRLSMSLEAGWRHAFDAGAPEGLMAFAEGGIPFAVRGPAPGRGAAFMGLELAFRLSGRMELSAGYQGYLGRRRQGHSGGLQLNARF
jgi:outer membrane autotransporter protein